MEPPFNHAGCIARRVKRGRSWMPPSGGCFPCNNMHFHWTKDPAHLEQHPLIETILSKLVETFFVLDVPLTPLTPSHSSSGHLLVDCARYCGKASAKCSERICLVGHHLLCKEMRNRERPHAARRVWQLVEEAICESAVPRSMPSTSATFPAKSDSASMMSVGYGGSFSPEIPLLVMP